MAKPLKDEIAYLVRLHLQKLQIINLPQKK